MGRKLTTLLILISSPPPTVIANAVCCADARKAMAFAALVAAVEFAGVTVGGSTTVPGGTVTPTLVETQTPPKSVWKYGVTRFDTRIGMRGPNRKFVSVVSR